MIRSASFGLVILLFAASSSDPLKPLTKSELCKQFMPSVVRIDTAADMVATGFIVSPDGWILTVAHILFDAKGQRVRTIPVHMPDGSIALPQVFVDAESAYRDFSLLKVEKSNLPYLSLGSESEVTSGDDIAIIGYPFSAGTEDHILPTKFCLFGSVAATDSITKNGTKVDAIYFQGPAVKGLSGSPIISLQSGHVVGIQTAKLAGISIGLDKVGKDLISEHNGMTASMSLNGNNINQTISDLIVTLDRHLANGLGVGTAIDDPKYFLSKTQRTKTKEHKAGAPDLSR
jgi:S1-C subfamily serine protease